MTILLKKDGRLIIDADQPLEGVSLDNIAAILSGASDGDVIQYDATNGMWVNKSAPSSLPEVTASDKGKYLKANESTGDPEWASGGSSGGGVLVVTVTDGMLDKTWQEIHDGGFGVVAVGDDTDISYMPITNVYRNSGEYGVGVLDTMAATLATAWYLASSADEYPELEQGGESAPK